MSWVITYCPVDKKKLRRLELDVVNLAKCSSFALLACLCVCVCVSAWWVGYANCMEDLSSDSLP